MFNTLKYAKMLEEVGFSREQAETSVSILLEVMEEKLATKQDVADIRYDIQILESKMTIKLGAMLGATIAIMTALQKFFIH